LEPLVKAEIRRGTLKGVKVGFLTGLCLAAIYAVIGALGDTELNKSLGFSLLLVGFPTLFAVVPALQWLGAQGGTREGVVILLLTLSLNGALWGAIIGAAVSVGSLGHRKRIRPQS
jgi:O-antigen/teichoic acid export membrane protein